MRLQIPTPNSLTKKCEILMKNLEKLAKNSQKMVRKKCLAKYPWFYGPTIIFLSKCTATKLIGQSQKLANFVFIFAKSKIVLNDHKIFFNQKMPTHQTVNLAPCLGQSGSWLLGQLMCPLAHIGIASQQLETQERQIMVPFLSSLACLQKQFWGGTILCRINGCHNHFCGAEITLLGSKWANIYTISRCPWCVNSFARRPLWFQ